MSWSKLLDAAINDGTQPEVTFQAILKDVEPDKAAVKKALKCLKPIPELLSECRHEIEVALMLINHDPPAAPRSSDNKDALKALKKALGRIQRAQKELAPSDATALRELYSLLPRAMAYCEEGVTRALPAPRPPGHRQRQAVAMAYHLLRLYGYTTREGEWHELAKILHGKDTTLINHLRTYRQKLRNHRPEASIGPGKK